MYRGVLISWGWNGEVPLCTEASSFQGVGMERFQLYTEVSGGSSFQGIGMERFHCILIPGQNIISHHHKLSAAHLVWSSHSKMELNPTDLLL